VFLQGSVFAEAGFVDFSRPDLPSLSQDVTVHRPDPLARSPNGAAPAPSGTAGAAPAAPGADSGPKGAAPAAEGGAAVGFDLSIDLGPSFLLRGSGVDTRLEGVVRLRSEGRGIVRASGAVETRDGVFEGFGQRLPITRGRINFQGAPDNPGLDILALRTNLPTEAGEIGVAITRTAANPLIRLYSDPALPDVDVLSWLVLGRPRERSGTDNLALASAAAGLLSGTGEGASTRLARELGIDDISLRSGTVGAADSRLPAKSVAGYLRGDAVTANTTANQIVSVGKRINDALTLTYEQAVSGAGSIVQLSYRLSRNLNLVGRAGTENALDLVYSISFD
jgi:translocation and assembly module TamB